MDTGIHNTSEIGRLKKVMLHRPGGELENLMPEYLERLLFDDIPYLKRWDWWGCAPHPSKFSSQTPLYVFIFILCPWADFVTEGERL